MKKERVRCKNHSTSEWHARTPNDNGFCTKCNNKLFCVGAKVRLRADVLNRHSMSKPAHAGYTTAEFAWRELLGKLAGKTGEISLVFDSKHRNVKFENITVGIDWTELELI